MPTVDLMGEAVDVGDLYVVAGMVQRVDGDNVVIVTGLNGEHAIRVNATQVANLQTIIDGLGGGGGGAPTTADYLVKTANAGLSAERVVGDSTSVTANWATAGAVSFERAALTGDVTASANSNATTIAANAVTFAKMQDIATDTLIGRATAGTGDPEAITCTAAGRALLDDASAAAQRTTLGLGPLATAGTPLAISLGGTGQTTAIDAYTALAPASGGSPGFVALDADINTWVFFDLSGWPDGSLVQKDSGVAGTQLKYFTPGALASLSTINNAQWSGTDLAVLNGGTGASDATNARANLGVPPSTRNLTVSAPITGGGDLSADRSFGWDGTTALDNNARVAVENNGTLVGTRRTINFIPGTNVTLNIADDAGNEEVDVTINASGGAGLEDFNVRKRVSLRI
jgi:hypothetical protein